MSFKTVSLAVVFTRPVIIIAAVIGAVSKSKASDRGQVLQTTLS